MRLNDQPKRIKSLFLALAAGFVMQSEGSPTPRGRDSATKDSGGKGGSKAEKQRTKTNVRGKIKNQAVTFAKRNVTKLVRNRILLIGGVQFEKRHLWSGACRLIF